MNEVLAFRSSDTPSLMTWGRRGLENMRVQAMKKTCAKDYGNNDLSLGELGKILVKK